MLIGWYLGVALELVILARLMRRRWVRRLPCFSIFILIAFLGNLALLFTQGTPRYAAVYRFGAPIGLLAQLAASIEAFWWCAADLPKFREVGAYLMLLCAGIAVGFERWTDNGSIADILTNSLAQLERTAGFFLFFFLVAALIVYALFGRIPHVAKKHSWCLAAISVVNAVGWQMEEGRMSRMAVTLTITWGTAAGLGGWLWLVTDAPTGVETQPSGTYDRGEQEEGWKRVRKAAGG